MPVLVRGETWMADAPMGAMGDFWEDFTGFFADMPSWFGGAMREIAQAIEVAWDGWDGFLKLARTVGGAYYGIYWFVAEKAYTLTRDLAEGKPVPGVVYGLLKEEVVSFARDIQKASPYWAMVPGIGQGVGAALNSAAALALGQPVEYAEIETLCFALPGGPAVQHACRIASAISLALAKGKELAEGTLAAIREELVISTGEIGAAAFDAALALARGKTLREAGFATLYQYTRGNEPVDRAAHFAEAMVVAAEQGRDVKDVLIEQLGDALEQYGRQTAIAQVRTVAKAILEDAELAKMSPRELAARFQVAEEIANAAQAAIKWIDDGTDEGAREIDEAVIEGLDPRGRALRFGLEKPSFSVIDFFPPAVRAQIALRAQQSTAIQTSGAPSVAQTPVGKWGVGGARVEGRPDLVYTAPPTQTDAWFVVGGGVLAAAGIGWYFAKR